MNVQVLAQTPGGKEIGIRNIEGTPLYEIAFKTGGEVPKELKGAFSMVRAAQTKIDAWLSTYQPQKKTTKKAK